MQQEYSDQVLDISHVWQSTKVGNQSFSQNQKRRKFCMEQQTEDQLREVCWCRLIGSFMH